MIGKSHPTRRIKGFSLLELSFTLAILGILLQGYFAWKHAHIEELGVERTIEGLTLIDEAAYAFFVDNNRWPRHANELFAATPFIINRNAFGKPYAMWPSGTGFLISTSFENRRQRNSALAAFPSNGVAIGANQLRIGIPRPGTESANSALLPRSGGADRPMTGNLVMNNNDIEEVAGISLTEVNRMGRRCEGNRLTRGVESRLVICIDNFWRNVSPSVGLKDYSVFPGGKAYPPRGFALEDCIISTDTYPPKYRYGQPGYGSTHFTTYADRVTNTDLEHFRIVARADTPRTPSGHIEVSPPTPILYSMTCVGPDHPKVIEAIFWWNLWNN